VPAALKKKSNATLKTFISSSLLYLSYLALTGNPLLASVTVTQQTIYGLAAMGAITGVSALTKVYSRKQEITRMFVL